MNLADHGRSQLDELHTSDIMRKVMTLMEGIGKKCKEILVATEIEGFSPDEVALAFGFKSAATVAQTKYRCMEKLKLAVQNAQLI